MMKSYAQNFEDVILWRALNDVSQGFYIDLGAQHPILDSVSRWFYEQGWRGIHVEPVKLYADLLRQDRPDEDVIQSVVSEETGNHIVYTFPGTGLSTLSAEIAAEHKANLGRGWQQEVASSVTLAELFDRVGGRDVHWFKVDVEGHEHSALASWGSCPVRPWIVLVESTYPNAQTETYNEWEYLLTSRGYTFVYADGLNRYYLHADHEGRREYFRYPPNYFDHFSLGEHWATYDLRTRNMRDLQEAGDLRQQAEHEKEQALAALNAARQQALERYEGIVASLSEMFEGLSRQTIEQVAEIEAGLVVETARFHNALEAGIRRSEARAFEVQHAMEVKFDGAQKALAAEVRQFGASMSRAAVRLEDEGRDLRSQIRQISEDFRKLEDALYQTASSRWIMLKALLHPRKRGLLARERMSNTAPLQLKAAYSDATVGALRAGSGERNGHAQGPSKLTEGDIFQSGTLGDLYALPPVEFINMSYRILLGRDGDESGLSHYLGRMALGDSRLSVHKSIVCSAEYRARARHDDLMGLSDDDFVEAAYRRVLGRSADEEGRLYYIERLRRGKGRRKMLRDFARSKEARSRPTNPMARLREEIEMSLSKRFGVIGRRQASRRMAQLDFTLSAALRRMEIDLRQQVGTLRADVDKLAQISTRNAVGAPRTSSTLLARPRWVPRNIRLAREAVTVSGRDQAAHVHPDYLSLTTRMGKEAPFGRLNNAREGQWEIDDYLENAYGVEDHGQGPLRWIGGEALVFLRVTGGRFNMRAAGFFVDRSVLISFDDVVIGTLRFGKEQSAADISVKDWIGRDVMVRLKCDGSFNPAAAGTSSDQRDLGVLIHSIYFE